MILKVVRLMFLPALTRFLPKKRVRKEKKLIRGDDEPEVEPIVEDAPAQTIIGHWSNNLTLTLVAETSKLKLNELSPAIGPHVKAVPPAAGDEPKHYYPIVFPNDFWLLRENMMPINDTFKHGPAAYQLLYAVKHEVQHL